MCWGDNHLHHYGIPKQLRRNSRLQKPLVGKGQGCKSFLAVSECLHPSFNILRMTKSFSCATGRLDVSHTIRLPLGTTNDADRHGDAGRQNQDLSTLTSPDLNFSVDETGDEKPSNITLDRRFECTLLTLLMQHIYVHALLQNDFGTAKLLCSGLHQLPADLNTHLQIQTL